jgi:putative YhdH/YhfP family quinone oxidoreductase
MSAIPATFRAYVAEKIEEGPGVPAIVERGVREFREADLSPGEVEIRVAWSSVNYKDGLATRVDGKVARISPLIPGIDLAGEVVGSDDRGQPVGSTVLAHGYELGVSRHGGFSEYERVPAGWVVPLAPGLSARDAMSIGTAGFTAAMSVAALEDRGLSPDDGPVLVTGASGGVGGTALAILADRGYEVWAATGKTDEAARLRTMGAAGILTRDEVTGEGRALESERWAGAVDAVGGATTSPGAFTLSNGELRGGRDHSPRMQVGRAIVQRETWTLQPDDELRQAAERGGDTAFAAFRKFRKRHALPETFFVRGCLPHRLNFHKDVKPMFMDFRNPLLVEVLSKITTRFRRLSVTEMLPRMEDCWLEAPGGGHHSCEFRVVVMATQESRNADVVHQQDSHSMSVA